MELSLNHLTSETISKSGYLRVAFYVFKVSLMMFVFLALNSALEIFSTVPCTCRLSLKVCMNGVRMEAP